MFSSVPGVAVVPVEPVAPVEPMLPVVLAGPVASGTAAVSPLVPGIPGVLPGAISPVVPSAAAEDGGAGELNAGAGSAGGTGVDFSQAVKPIMETRAASNKVCFMGIP